MVESAAGPAVFCFFADLRSANFAISVDRSRSLNFANRFQPGPTVSDHLYTVWTGSVFRFCSWGYNFWREVPNWIKIVERTFSYMIPIVWDGSHRKRRCPLVDSSDSTLQELSQLLYAHSTDITFAWLFHSPRASSIPILQSVTSTKYLIEPLQRLYAILEHFSRIL